MTKGKKILYYSVIIVIGIYFFFLGLAKAKGFLAPFFTALILSLMVLPLSNKMESWGLKRSYASILNTILLFILSLGFLALVSFQIKNFVDDWPNIKSTMAPKIEQFKEFVFEHTALNKTDLESSSSGSGLPFVGSGSSSNQGQKAVSFLTKTLSFLATYLLTFIYIFFMLAYRRKFKEFLIRLYPDDKKDKVKSTLSKSASVTQQYLVGKLILMGLLAVLYSIGLGLSGVNNFILVSLIASLLTLIPYIGNVIGFTLAVGFGYLSSGSTGVLIGIILTFSIAQFVESYILQPYLVGDKVDVHPFVVILTVVIGGAVWGVIGMILAIPVMAIITVVFLHVPSLHPFGYLFSKEKDDS